MSVDPYNPQPVAAQPAQLQPAGPPPSQLWMPPPAPITGCPPGLEYLAQLECVLIEQEIDVLELFTGIEQANRFKVLNNLKQQIFYAAEQSSMMTRILCGPNRGFTFRITDNNNLEVFRVVRDFQCGKGMYCCPMDSCRYFARVDDKNGVVLGWISNLQFCCSPTFGIFDEKQDLVAEIRGPCCPMQNFLCRADVDFPIIETATGQVSGTISKTWPGNLKSCFTKADNFRCTFPVSMDAKRKALMIGASFVMDLMLYETGKQAM